MAGKRVIGIGGVFFKARDPEKLNAWYAKHLGIEGKPGEGVTFPWRRADDPSDETVTAWSTFPQDTEYFGPGPQSLMINYQVDDLDAVLDALKTEGVTIVKREDHDYGRFAWIVDPEGNRIELWETPTKKRG